MVDGASEALSKAGEIKSRVDAVREELGSLAQREPPSDEGGADDDAGAKTAAPQQEPASEPAEGYIDYSTTWHDPPRSHIVVTQVVHRPVRVPPPAPPPELSYEPRAHGFVGLSLRGTSTTNHNPSVLTGGRLGFVFDDRFTIGGAFYSLTARFGGPITDPVGNKLGMRMAYGGVLLGWTLYKGRVVQLGLETLAGAGAETLVILHERDGQSSYQEANTVTLTVAIFASAGEDPILQGFNNNPALTVSPTGNLMLREIAVSNGPAEGVAVNGGDLKAAEGMLLAQAVALNAMFTDLARLGDAGQVTLDVGHEHRHAELAEVLGQRLQRDRLAGAGGAGDQPVAVGQAGQQVAFDVAVLGNENRFGHRGLLRKGRFWGGT